MKRTTTAMSWILLVSAAAALTAAGLVLAQDPGDTLARGFQEPPDSARPRVWWHWMSGNITKEGIQADLEWMKRAGVAGFQNFDAGLDTPQIVAKRLVYMTPAWKDAFRFTATLADKLGLEMAIAGSPGWSESGGPWVPPAQAMKKYVWSETRLEGGKPWSGVLPKPPTATGPYQNIPTGRDKEPQFYADSAVVALRLPDHDRTMAELGPKVTSSGGTFDLASLTDGDLANSHLLPAAKVGEQAWIQIEFPAPQTVRGLTLRAERSGRGVRLEDPELVAIDDAGRPSTVAKVPSNALTLAFAPATARVFRLVVKTAEPDAPQGGGPANNEPAGTRVAELVLHGVTPVNRFQDKAAFDSTTGLSDLATPAVPEGEAVKKAEVVDLTSKMRPDGRLDWTPPAGRWLVLRFGYSLTGARNAPASPEATGLEVDKLDKGFVKAYFDNYLDQYKNATGGLMGKRGLQYVITDSWEAGVANWTDKMFAEFLKRRGYDMHPWLPALAGRIVESAEASDRFLWDFRKTLGDLVAEYHYDQLTDLLHARGMGRYTESHEGGRAFIGDGMDVKRRADIPMSATWLNGPGQPSRYHDADVRESASVAHLYGQNLVAAESLTVYRNAWMFSPETLKSTADRMMTNGLNRFVIHTSVHQPTDDKIPGLGLGPFGQWFTRHETWAEMARPWTTYLARSSFMLQQGRFVADVLYYYGEDSNVTALFGDKMPDLPAGTNYDFASSDVVLSRLAVKDGRIVTPTGMSYRLLALDANCRRLPLAVLRKIRDLVGAGAVLVGPKPVDSPSLADDQAEFQAIAGELWGGNFGQGRVFGSSTVAEALAAIGAGPDFAYTKTLPDTELAFVHRALPDGDVYWVVNRETRPETIEASFRVTGKEPELWHAETGAVEPASYLVANGRTVVPLRLSPDDAVFVVFRKPAAAPARALPDPVETELAKIAGPWDVAFQPGRGAPASARFDALGSWSENADPGIKYFSGTATYKASFDVPAHWFVSGTRYWLDLGDVKNVAEIKVNGQPLGTVWKRPFRVDATEALKPGANALEIKVANLWVNRLVGDKQPGVTKPYTYTAVEFYKADSPLLPSGLLGPVRVVGVK
jgi:(4-O-methyl)-D-glucuronate---lignin esterase